MWLEPRSRSALCAVFAVIDRFSIFSLRSGDAPPSTSSESAQSETVILILVLDCGRDLAT
jgi:hypothetical protein